MSELQLMTIGDAAQIAKVSTRSIRRALTATQNQLRCYRLGRSVRIARTDLEQWITAHRSLSALSPAVLDRVSPAARQLLDGLRIRTPAAPSTRKPADSQGRPAGSFNGAEAC